MKHRCLFCNGDRLMSPREPVEKGSMIICGACCGLMVLDVLGNGVPRLRQPTIDERRAALKDDAVNRAIDEYNKLLFNKGSGKAKGSAAPTMLAYGPDHPKSRQ